MENSAIITIKDLGFPWDTMNPFLFCVHHLDKYPNGKENMGPDASLDGRNIGNDFVIKDGWRMYHGDTVPGFPMHPHRGFETITVVLKGLVDHSDSQGASGRYGNGDVQWMTAGKGLQHAEMFPLLNEESENTLELFQIWLNLPASKKFVEPHFSMLWEEAIPVYKTKDTNERSVEVIVIAGNIESTVAALPAPNSWASDPENEVAIWRIKMEAGAKWQVPVASGDVNRSIFFFQGNSIALNEKKFTEHKAIEVKPDAEILLSNGDSESYLLLLQGKPIDEAVVQYGPFVMNSQEEIRQAMMDYQKTQFGGWPWPRHDQVHGREKSRFAKYANGDIHKP